MWKVFLIAMMAAVVSADAEAGDTSNFASSDWNSNYGFPSASSVMNRLTRAQLIEKQNERGLQTQVNQWQYSTMNIDSLSSFDVSGSGNTLSTTQSSSGNSSNSTIGGMVNDPPGSRAVAR